MYSYFKQIKGQLHSATCNDPSKHLFLFDEINMYVITTEPTNKMTVYENIYCLGINAFDAQSNYAICQDKIGAEKPGLRIFDVDSILKSNQIDFNLLKKVDIGCAGTFEFSYGTCRFAFMKSITHLLVFPILHLNYQKFMGANKGMEKYICIKQSNDKFITFGVDKKLITWSTTTGKLLYQKSLNFEYPEVEVVSKSKSNAVLAKTLEEINLADFNMKKEDFFQSYQLQTNTKNQLSYSSTLEIKFNRFLSIEIRNEGDVDVHADFIFPSFEN